MTSKMDLLIEEPPRVSWLLCSNVLNDHLRFSIQSCFNQTFQDFELIFVANGPQSTDIAAIVNSWFGSDSRLRIFSTNVTHLNFSLNLGLHHARSALIARIDSDDLNKPDRLENQVAFMDQHADVVVLGSAFDIIDLEGRLVRSVSMPIENKKIRSAMVWRNPLCHPSVMFRTSVVKATGGYLGGIYAEDYDLWSRLILDPTNRFANLTESCIGYRSVGVGFARGSRVAYASMAAAQFRNFVLGAGFIWLLASFITFAKSVGVRRST